MLAGTRTLRDGIAAVMARDFESAYPLLQHATIEHPTDVAAWIWRAVASPTPADAIPCLRRVLVFEPTHAEAQQALARLLAGQAAALAISADRAEALTLAREATGLAPDCDAVWVGLAAICEDPDERLDALRRAHELNPQTLATRGHLRDALLHGGVAAAGSHPARARELFREAAAVDPADPRVWQALARVAASPADAVKALRELFRLAPDRPGVKPALKRAMTAEAVALAAEGLPADAAGRWREILALDDTDGTAWLGLAGVTEDRGEALRALDAARRGGLAGPQLDALAARWDAPAPAAVEPAIESYAAPAEPFTAAPVVHPFATAPAAAHFAPPPAAEHVAPVPAAEPVAAAPGIEPSAPAPPVVPPPAAPVAAPFAPVESRPAAAIEPHSDPPRPVAPFVPRPVPLAAPPAPPLRTAASDTPGKRTVMIVDDSPTVRKILSMTLERAGYGVLSAADGEAALGALESAVPDLVLLDISMPKLDGYEVCKRIKANARTAHVPVVMLSGKDAFFDKVKGRMAGATEYLTKPFATPAVLAVISRQFEAAAGAANG
jgi:twitching motility two-component system response regulator PilG